MSYKYPLFKLNFDEKEKEALFSTLDSKWISTGPITSEFEEKFSSMLNVSHSLALTNCTVALHLAMQLVGVGPGDEVICPSLTFVATCNAIRYMGAIPVFADIESIERPVISPYDIESRITLKTKAIVVMHYAGFACDMDSIMNIANKYRLKVIEDACHAPLSEYKGKKLGTIGDIGCFSFFSNKNISTGEGGMLVTNSKEYHLRASLLRSHGMTSLSYQRSTGHITSYDVVEFGYNYRLDDIRSSLGLVQLGKLEEDLDRRSHVRRFYIENLVNNKKVIIPFKTNNEYSSNYIFPIVIDGFDVGQRDTLRTYLHGKGIQTSMHYPPAHRFSIYREFYTDLPLTDSFVDTTLTLPMYGSLQNDDVKWICEKVNDGIKKID